MTNVQSIVRYDFVIEHHEPNPHQFKEALTKNRTYHLMRWKEKYIIKNSTIEEAREFFNQFGNNYRLVNLSNGKIIKQNHCDFPR